MHQADTYFQVSMVESEVLRHPSPSWQQECRNLRGRNMDSNLLNLPVILASPLIACLNFWVSEGHITFCHLTHLIRCKSYSTGLCFWPPSCPVQSCSLYLPMIFTWIQDTKIKIRGQNHYHQKKEMIYDP